MLCFSTASLFVLGYLTIALWGDSQPLVYAGALMIGFATSGTLSISLTIIAQQGKDAAETAVISAVSQCIGYACSAFGPTGLGYLYDVARNWQIVMVCLIIMSVGMSLLGLYAGKPDAQTA